MRIHQTEFILYVKNQAVSTDFYSHLLQRTPVLNVPGMTEFLLSNNCKLGLMPNSGITKILTEMPHPDLGSGIPRCELYFYVDIIEEVCQNAVNSGAKLISELSNRNWGDKVAYFADPDGHIIAFAEKII